MHALQGLKIPKSWLKGLTAWQGQQSYSWCHPAIGGIVYCQVSGGPLTVAASYPGCFVKVRTRSVKDRSKSAYHRKDL